jgi:hypothetical protein
MEPLSRDNEVGIAGGHPGAIPITPELKELIDICHGAWTRPFNFPLLEWFKFWVDWSLESCNTPVFCNW